MNRIQEVQKVVDSILMKQTDLEVRRDGYIHLYGVSSSCSLLALRRNADAELAAVSGMLHDIYYYKTLNSCDHAKLGSIEARKILGELKIFNEEEINAICNAIYNHSNKKDIGTIYEEILKDGDVLNHYFYNVDLPAFEHEKDRLHKLFDELGIK